VEFCTELGNRSIIMEGDALEIVSALRKEEGWPSKYNNFMEEARDLLSCFHRWSVNYVRRECNVVAHSLSQLVAKHCLHHVWFDTWLHSLVYPELSGTTNVIHSIYKFIVLKKKKQMEQV
jgi:hypothetical protein